jgi:hypothetical protein
MNKPIEPKYKIDCYNCNPNKYEIDDDELDIDGKPTIIFDCECDVINQDWIVYFYQLKIWNKQNE